MSNNNQNNIITGDLVGGLDNIAEYMGIPANEIVFINEYCLKNENFRDMAEPADWVLSDTWSSQYLLTLMRDNATSIMMPVPQTLRDYLESVDLASPDSKIISCCNNADITSRFYPKGSVVGQILQNKQFDLTGLSAKTVASSFVTPDVQQLADSINGRCLMTSKQSIQFNSKAFLREVNDNNYLMAYGVIINKPQDTDLKIKEMKEALSASNSIGVWQKISLAAGGGTKFLPQLDKNMIERGLSSFVQDAAMAYQNIPIRDVDNGFVPYVLEIDLQSMPDINILGNYGVQAVVGDNNITFVGTTKQRTEEGEYEGGDTLFGDKERELEKDLIKGTLPVFQKYQQKGYRGIMGVDAIMATNQENDKRVYILEANCRFTAATPLLSTVQVLQKQNADEICGSLNDMTIEFNPNAPEDSVQKLLQAIGQDLYRGRLKQGGMIVPILLDSFPNLPYGGKTKSRMRCVTIGRDPNETEAVYKRVSSRLNLI